MRVTVGKRLTVHMHEYETLTWEAQVSVTHTDLGYTADQPIKDTDAMEQAVVDRALAVLDDLLRPDVEQAAELSRDRKSFIHHYELDPEPKKGN